MELTKLSKIERTRTYFFQGGEQVQLTDVTHIIVQPSGTHRLKTKDGKFHIIPKGWLRISLDTDALTF